MTKAAKGQGVGSNPYPLQKAFMRGAPALPGELYQCPDFFPSFSFAQSKSKQQKYNNRREETNCAGEILKNKLEAHVEGISPQALETNSKVM